MNSAKAMYGHYFLFFASVGFFSPFLPLFLAEINLSSIQIGLLLSIQPLTTIITQGIWGSYADRHNKRKEYLILAVALAAFFCVFLSFSSNPWVIGVFLFLYAGANCAVNPLSDAIILNTLEDRTAYGSIRSWGSIGFAIAAAVGGVIFSHISLAWFGAIAGGVLFLTIGWTRRLPNPCSLEHGLPSIESPIQTILKTPKIPAFILSAVLIMITHNAYISFFGWHLKTLNTPNLWIGVGWFIGAASEILVFMKGKDWLKRYSPPALLLMAAAAYTLRWIAYAFMGHYGWILVLQISQCLCFALFYLAGVEYLNCLLPVRLQASMQSVLAIITFGVSAIIGNLGAGWILQIFQIRGMYLTMALLSALGGLCIWKFLLPKTER